jgi:hypothetical protein
MDNYVIGFDGFITVTASSEEKAFEKANAYLSKSNLVNDGDTGEWYLTSIKDFYYSEEAN